MRKYVRAHPNVLVALIVVVSLAFWTLSGSATWLSMDVMRGLPTGQQIAGIGNMAQATTLYDIADKPVFAVFKEQRIEVPLANVSPHLIKAIVSIEDQRFFDHRGLDLVRVGAAALANMRQGRAAQGGSTITQQLARQSFLTLDKTFRRKIRELIVAAAIERAYTKEQILELYLNKVYFGDGFHGVEAASLGFFGRHASELTVSQAALLAGLVQSPSTYAPTVNLARARSRRDVVLAAMFGTDVIDRPTYDAARRDPIRLRNALRGEEDFGLYFKEQVRRELVDRFGWDRVYQGGLKVYTTIDPPVQRAAEVLAEKALTRIEAHPRYKHPKRGTQPGATTNGSEYLQVALLALEPNTGYVRALVGGRNFGESHFNRATQAKRQPGSAFKPFVFAAALEAGYTPASMISNLSDPILTAQGAWVPEDEHSTAEAMTLRTALRTSSNRAAVQLLRAIGIPKALEYAGKLSVGNIPAVPSLALGAGEVTLQSMTGAFAAFANRGLVMKPVLIRRVEDETGRVLYRSDAQPQRAISEATAFMMANMLADVINAGTAYRARREGFVLPAAGKTGTTNDYHDAWFVGFTPHFVAGVWVGFDQPRTILSGGYAGDLAVPLWASFMKAATKSHEPKWFERPKGVVGVEICRLSGKLPVSGCYNVETVTDEGEYRTRSYVSTEYFRAGTEPESECGMHSRGYGVDQIADGWSGNEPPPQAGRRNGPVREATAPADESHSASPTSTTGAIGTPPIAEPQPAPEKKKRGFWSRLFGLGKKEKDKEKEKKKPNEQ